MLGYRIGYRVSVIAQVIWIQRIWLPGGQPIDNKAIVCEPLNEFSHDFEEIYEAFFLTVNIAPTLSRRSSKEVKNNFLWQFWRYSIGSLITNCKYLCQVSSAELSGNGKHIGDPWGHGAGNVTLVCRSLAPEGWIPSCRQFNSGKDP